MSSQYIEIPEIGEVKVLRRRGLKHIRISVTADGEVRLSVPWYVPKSAGVRYAVSKKIWVKEQLRNSTDSRLKNNQAIIPGTTVKISYTDKKRVSSFEASSIFHILIPRSYGKNKSETTAQKACEKFLLKKSEQIVLPMLQKIANQNGTNSAKVRFKNLKSRWGSCDNKGNITLNTQLVRLDGKYIVYVIQHELAHIKYLNHSQDFWAEVAEHLPEFKKVRLELKSMHPTVRIAL